MVAGVGEDRVDIGFEEFFIFSLVIVYMKTKKKSEQSRDRSKSTTTKDQKPPELKIKSHDKPQITKSPKD